MSKTLSKLEKGDQGIVREVKGPDVARLMEMGFIKGERVEVLHEGPIGRDPMAVRVRGGILALRRSEAQWIYLEGEQS